MERRARGASDARGDGGLCSPPMRRASRRSSCRDATSAERRLWQGLRRKQVSDFRFRRKVLSPLRRARATSGMLSNNSVELADRATMSVRRNGVASSQTAQRRGSKRTRRGPLAVDEGDSVVPLVNALMNRFERAFLRVAVIVRSGEVVDVRVGVDPNDLV